MYVFTFYHIISKLYLVIFSKTSKIRIGQANRFIFHYIFLFKAEYK